MFKRKKKNLAILNASFGNPKTESFNFKLIQRFFEHHDHANSLQTINDQTCEDLDFGLFFAFVDRTNSKIGQQYLYHKLRSISPLSEEINHREKLIEYLLAHPKERLELQYELNKLNGYSTYYMNDLFQKEIPSKPKWAFLLPLLSITALSSLILSFFLSKFFLIFLALIPINVIIHYGLKQRVNLLVNSIPSLLTMGKIAHKFSKSPHLRVFEQYSKPSIQIIQKIRRKMSLFKFEHKIDSDMEAAYWFLLESIKIMFLIEPVIFFNVQDLLIKYRKHIEQVYQYIGEVDVAISVASLRTQSEAWCIPTIKSSGNHVFGENIRHPLIIDCVPNSLPKEHKSILLTGSNMSGKTTFIRAIGLNYIAGMTLNTCFADSFTLSPTRLLSLIRVSDDISSSSSYFLQEVKEVKHIIDSSKSYPSLILMDELFKGTNTTERIASAKAILAYLSSLDCQVFVATHDIELTELLGDKYHLYYFSESVIDSEIHFDYKLKRGTPKQGNAIKILEINKFPKEIISDAYSLI